MQFKNPELLYALFLLVIPILIHLFQLRRFQKVEFTNVPSYLEIKTNFESLEPDQHGLIIVEYNTHKIDDWDFVVDDIGVVVNTVTREEGHFSVSANIREDFSKLTKEGLATKPKISKLVLLL